MLLGRPRHGAKALLSLDLSKVGGGQEHLTASAGYPQAQEGTRPGIGFGDLWGPIPQADEVYPNFQGSSKSLLLVCISAPLLELKTAADKG